MGTESVPTVASTTNEKAAENGKAGLVPFSSGRGLKAKVDLAGWPPLSSAPGCPDPGSAVIDKILCSACSSASNWSRPEYKVARGYQTSTDPRRAEEIIAAWLGSDGRRLLRAVLADGATLQQAADRFFGGTATARETAVPAGAR